MKKATPRGMALGKPLLSSIQSLILSIRCTEPASCQPDQNRSGFL
jgi:hypothetical protein